MSKEAMKLALEAVEVLEKLFKQAEAMHKGVFPSCNVDCQITLEDLRKGLYAAPALREALAEQPAPVQQEPVATLWQHGETGRTRITMPGDITDCDARWFKAADLYASPPAQRTWVGLTDEQIVKCWGQVSGTRHGYVAFARAIESAHGIKEQR